MRRAATAGRIPAHAGARKGLLWTEWWFLLGVLAATIVVVDPLEWRLASHVVAKHLGLLIAVPAAGMAVMGRFAFPRAGAGPVRAPLGVAWPLALLAILILGGSLNARLALGHQSTFLNLGLYVAMTFAAAAMVLASEAPQALLRAYFGILLGAALVMSALLVENYGVRQVYHEQIFLVIPMAVLAFAGVRRRLVRWAGVLFFLSMAWFSHKYTAYLVAALTVAYIAVAIELPARVRRGGLSGVAAAYWCALAAAGALVAAGLATFRGDADEPSGNVEYRLHTYQAALDRFAESPLWGNLFVTEAAEKFTLFDTGVAGNVLPTHSDALDLLANGGLLAIVLWGAGLLAVAASAWRALLRPTRSGHPLAAAGHALAVLTLAAIVTCAFNPILLQPSMAALVWSNLGMLLGASLRARDG